MPRKQKRQRLARGIYTDGATSVEIEVMVKGYRITERHPARAPLAYLIERRDLLKRQGQAALPAPTLRGTIAGDADRYLKLQRSLHPTTVKTQRAHLAAWAAALGDKARHLVTEHDVLEARNRWLDDGDSPKTVNHRVATLRRLFRLLDGRRAPTPCDDVRALPVHKTPIQRVTPERMLTVFRGLLRLHERPPGRQGLRTPEPECRKTAARFAVLISTGRRPSEVMRAQKTDVDLEARVWVPRDGKGGWSPGIYLTDDMIAAWRLFIDADAWGDFSTSVYAKRLRAAGWPADVSPYQARHNLLIALVEAGADMADVQIHAGHRNIATTRTAYTGVLRSRQQRTSELIEGRFGGFSAPEDSGTTARDVMPAGTGRSSRPSSHIFSGLQNSGTAN